MANKFLSSNILELLSNGATYLDSCGVDAARAEADILLAHTLGLTRDRLYLEKNFTADIITEEEKTKYCRLLTRRANREPLAYLLNNREFMGLDFYVDQRVLIPRPETELLAEKVLEMVKNRKSRVPAKILDLCTGSGVLAITIAYFCPEVSVAAVDISAEALDVARYNADRLLVDIDFRQGDFLEPVKGEEFEIIAANPPYLSCQEYSKCSPEVRKEPSGALLAGEDGLEFYREMAGKAGENLLEGGRILMEIGWQQGESVKEIFLKEGFNSIIISDLAGLDRIVLAYKE